MEGTNTFLLTVECTDEGVPPRTASFTYSVHVVPGTQTLIVTELLRSFAGVVVLQWRSMPGRTYRVEETESLVPPIDWIPLTDVLAFDVMATLSEPTVGTRFYRVQELP
jgi:hypothetical protein